MKNTPITIVLPDIRSAMNVGAIFRTADAMGAEKIVLCGYSATPHHPKVVKTAIGAEKTVEWEYVPNATEAIASLRKRGYYIVALEKTDVSTDIFDAEMRFPVALIVGNEIHGVPVGIISECDAVMHLPMLGAKESLNVATATGIALYQMYHYYHLAIGK